MKISYNWLKEYIDTDLTAEQVADILTLTGLEVEEIEHIGSSFNGIVVGEVLAVRPHENADRLTVCTVNAGTGTDLQIICGAPNVRASQKVAVAMVGSVLPLKLEDGSNLVIKKAKIRGVASEGMICAEDELGLGDDHSGIMVLPADIEPGTPFSQIHSSYEDYVFEIGLTPNRPDASCHIGVARDLAAVTGQPLKLPANPSAAHKSTIDDRIDIRIENPDKCYRYVGMMVENVTIGPSPEWLHNRLKAIGLRPINNVVDVTNYVMYEFGQPLHAFDYQLISGKTIIVKDYDREIPFTTLDDIERTVPAGAIFICDGEKPVAIGGVMGGLNSEIADTTKTVFIESASFNPVNVRKTSKTLALQTESSYRFERGVDPNITRMAAARCADLIAETAGGTIVEGTTDVYPEVVKPAPVNLRPAFLKRILGTEIEINTVTAILERLGFQPQNKGSVIECLVPTFRPDVTMEIDLVEEVARIYNYNNIPTTGRIAFSKPSLLPKEETFQMLLRDTAKAMGFQEIYTNSLLPDQIAGIMPENEHLLFTLNPISKDQSLLRPTLGYGFLKTVAYNFNRLAEGMRLFELGNTFSATDNGTYHKGIQEEAVLLLGVAGQRSREHWTSPAVDYTVHDLKAAFDALARKLRLQFDQEVSDNLIRYTCSGINVGHIIVKKTDDLKKMDITRPVFYGELFVSALQNLYYNNEALTYKPVPKYPPFDFDFAIIVNKAVAAGDLERVTRKEAGPLLSNLDVFDIFEGKPLQDNEKSVAFRLRFIDDDKTLTIKDVQAIIEKILGKLEKQYQAKLRSQ
ncbi:MAG: phenylalanine--tRNA ligase subunit beta [Balneolaceae bacterium]|nr:MAG: phenylalanine--tRNA ligase subunit beta [Balneolaceae bacterium]